MPAGPHAQQGLAAATPVATLNSVGTEKLTATVLRGKQFFYDARDPRLARDRYMSCATCHNDGGHDGRVWDLTHAGEGLRNTIGLRGRAGAQGFLHWSNNFDEVQDFEGQIRSLAGGTGLMTDAQFNNGTRSQPLGTAKAGVSADLDALAAYVASLTAFDQTPMRPSSGALSTLASEGRTVFTNLNCASCHGGTAFSNSGVNNPVNIGTLKPSSGQRLGGPLTGNFTTDGKISVLGDRALGVGLQDVNGNVRVAGTITATGVDAIGARLSGNINGALVVQGTLTATGYRFTTPPADPSKLDADDLLLGGPA